MKLLIVDDSLIMRKAVERSLADKGFTIIGTAGDGEEGLRLFKENLPDLVTLDISMPKMDGVTCLREILKVKSDAKVLMITSQTDKLTSEEVLGMGAAGVLGKPFNAEQILAKANEIVGK